MTLISKICAALLIAHAGIVHAAQPAYPTRPVRLLVGFPPCSATDALARIITPRLGTAIGAELDPSGEIHLSASVPTSALSGFPCNKFAVFASSTTLLLLTQHLVCCIERLNAQAKAAA